MEPQFQTSFIPKKSISSDTRDSVGVQGPTSIFSVITTILFVVAIIACVALFAYKHLLISQLETAKSDLVSARDAFQPDTIKELTDVSGRISSTKKLLNSHISSSEVFNVLQSLTVKKVRFTSFSFDNKEGVFLITMGVEAQSYNALGAQQDIFSKTEFIQHQQFVDFSVSENGNIITNFSATINPEDLTYKKVLESLNQNQ